MELLPEHLVDWDAARRFMRRIVRSRLDREDPAVHDDLVQEALVRLLRAIRGEKPRDLEALMAEIAHRVTVDHLRRRKRWKLLVEPASEGLLEQAPAVSPVNTEPGDPVARIRFVVLNYFGDSDCGDLAQAYFAQLDWMRVAERVGRSHAAVRKQWSRCLERLRQAVAREPSLAPLADWAVD
jgi:RNA polymerase sigma factor (sigma-70 family)